MIPNTTPIVPENILAQAWLGIRLLARMEAPATLQDEGGYLQQRAQDGYHD